MACKRKGKLQTLLGTGGYVAGQTKTVHKRMTPIMSFRPDILHLYRAAFFADIKSYPPVWYERQWYRTGTSSLHTLNIVPFTSATVHAATKRDRNSYSKYDLQSIFKVSGAAQLRFVTDIVSKAPSLHVKRNPIRHGQSVYQFSDQKGPKALPFGAAPTYMAHQYG